MNVTIPPELAAFVREQVAAGRYPSEAEVVADALRLLDEASEVESADVPGWHIPLVEDALEAADRGEFSDATLDDILAEANGESA